MPTVAQLMKALPESEETTAAAAEGAEAMVTPLPMPTPLEGASMRPVPVGWFRRTGLLATLQAKITAAYFFYWVRGWFRGAGDRERSLAETHWRTAARVLD